MVFLLRSLRGEVDDDDAFFLLYVRMLSFSARFRVSFKFLSVVDANAWFITVEFSRLPNLVWSIKSDSSFENVYMLSLSSVCNDGSVVVVVVVDDRLWPRFIKLVGSNSLLSVWRFIFATNSLPLFKHSLHWRQTHFCLRTSISCAPQLILILGNSFGFLSFGFQIFF